MYVHVMCEVCPCNMKGQTLVITGVEGIPTNKQNKVFHDLRMDSAWPYLMYTPAVSRNPAKRGERVSAQNGGTAMGSLLEYG